MDKKIFLYMYEAAQKNKEIVLISAFVSRFSSKIFFVIYILMLAVLFIGESEKLYFCIVVPAVTFCISVLLRRMIKRDRPNEAFIHLSHSKKKTYSFPSNHSVSAFIIAFSCLYVNGFFGIVTIILALLTGVSRIFVGLHYPADVLAGFLISSIVFILALFCK